ncbi:MAG TPA: alternative ribosome rescue aminoacyl-tRNA hydrolase ArfB [Anaerolineales bacterium]
MSIRINPQIEIEESEIEEDFIRASGPGGQKVNKTSTAVQLRFDVANSQSLPEQVRKRLMKIASNRISTEGILRIESSQYRSQGRNRHDARRRLIQLIRQAAKPPKTRRKTKPTEASKKRRLEQKRRRSEIKRLRRNIPPPE